MKDLFKKLLDDLTSQDLLKEDKKEELETMFEDKLKDYKEQIFSEAVEAVEEDHFDKLNKVVEKIDEDHTALLDEVLTKIDEDSVKSLDKVVEKIDEDHLEGLAKVVAKYEKGMMEEIDEKVNDFLDVYLEDKMPEDKIVDKLKLTKLEEMFEEIKKVVVVSDISMDEEIKEAILDAKSIIEDKDAEVNQLMIEKIEVSKKLKKIEAKHLLEDKCKNVNPKLTAYLETRFQDNSVAEIEDQFEEAVKAFEEDETLLREDLKSKTSSNVNPKTIITEGVVDDKTKGTDSAMDMYINRYKRSKRFNS